MECISVPQWQPHQLYQSLHRQLFPVHTYTWWIFYLKIRHVGAREMTQWVKVLAGTQAWVASPHLKENRNKQTKGRQAQQLPQHRSWRQVDPENFLDSQPKWEASNSVGDLCLKEIQQSERQENTWHSRSGPPYIQTHAGMHNSHTCVRTIRHSKRLKESHIINLSKVNILFPFFPF